MKNKLIVLGVILGGLLGGFSACDKKEIKEVKISSSEGKKFSSTFEVTVPMRDNRPFCPASLQLGMEREALQRIEESVEDGMSAKYVHCKVCNIGVLSQTKEESTVLECSYCGAKPQKSE